MGEFGVELKRRRTDAGLSLAALAKSVYLTKGYLSKLENGISRANPTVAAVCDRVLGAGGALMALAERESAQRPRRRSRRLGSGLPETTQHFVGRETELHALLDVLRAPGGAAVCVIDGLAGAGKTTLAVEAARRAESSFPDGTCFLDLRGQSIGTDGLTSAEALDQLVRMIAGPDAAVPPDQAGREHLLRSSLHGKRVLLVLDNARSAEQVRPLLPADRLSRVLVTSRTRLLAFDDAVHMPLGELAQDEAIGLFRAISGVTAPTPDVQTVVDRCGRLPLAVRIAAARVGHGGWSVADLAERLNDELDRLAVLSDGERAVGAAFALACDRLPADQSRLLGLLALHPGTTAEVASVAALDGDRPMATDLRLDRLHDAHLVERRPAAIVHLHELVRAFSASEVLPGLAMADRGAAAQRLVDHIAARASAADTLLEPARYRPDLDLPRDDSFAGPQEALAWLRVWWPTVAAVVELAAAEGLHKRCWQLAFVLRGFFFRDKLLDAWQRTHLTALASAQALGDPAAIGITTSNLGMAHLEQGDLAGAAKNHRLALEVFTEAGNATGAADAAANLAWLRLYQGDATGSLDALTAALGTYRDQERPRNVMITLRGLALAAVELDRFDDALSWLTEAERMAGTPLDRLMAVNGRAWTHYRAGRLTAAEEAYNQVVAQEEAESAYELARALTGLANVAAARGGDTWTVRHLLARADELPVTLNPVVLGEAREAGHHTRLDLASRGDDEVPAN